MDGKIKLVLFILSGFFCLVFGCCERFKQDSPVGKDIWIYDAKLDDFLDLKIERIIICTPDDDNPNAWTSLFEISDPEKIRKSIEVLHKAERGIMPAWLEKMKIITKHKKFIMHFDWDDETAYGDHWVSKEFRRLLRQWGFPEPK